MQQPVTRSTRTFENTQQIACHDGSIIQYVNRQFRSISTYHLAGTVASVRVL
jgi:hypothetical protein